MRPLALAIATSALLAAGSAAANCNRELDRVDARVAEARLNQDAEQTLRSWIDQQKREYADASQQECTMLIAEINRQMVDYGYLRPAGTTQAAGTDAHEVAIGRTDVDVEAPPAQVQVQAPPARIEVQQRAADIDVKMKQPHVAVQVPRPQVDVTQPAPQVTVNQPDPEVTVNQPDPIVHVQQAKPKVNIQQAEPTVSVDQGQPQVQFERSQPVVQVQTAKPKVDVQSRQGTTQIVQQSRNGSSQNSPGERVQLDQLIGVAVIDADGQPLGEVRGAMQDRNTMQPVVLVDLDPALGADTAAVVIPAQDLARDGQQLRTDRSLDQLPQGVQNGRYQALDDDALLLGSLDTD